MSIIVRMPSGRVVEHTFNSQEEAEEFKADLLKIGLTSVIVNGQ